MEKINDKLFKKLNRKSLSCIKGGDYERSCSYKSVTGWTVCDIDTFDNNGKWIARRIVSMVPTPVPCDTIPRDTIPRDTIAFRSV